MSVSEFKENKAEIPPVQDSARLQENPDWRLDTVLGRMNEFTAAVDIGTGESAPDSKEAVREYGLKECCDAAMNVFTREVLSNWGKMGAEQRGQKIQEYSKSVAEGLHIDLKGIEYEKMNDSVNGYISVDGHIHLNETLLNQPEKVIALIDTVAHESRRLMQYEAVKNPENSGFDQAVIKEWEAAFGPYSDLSLDPLEFYNNSSESDARSFGESVVKELAKHLTAGTPLNEGMMSTLEGLKPLSAEQYASNAVPSFTGYCACGNRCGDHCFQSCSARRSR